MVYLIFRHVIPRDDSVRKIWLDRINNAKLFNVKKDSYSYRLCESHFEPECFVNGKLLKFALPTLNLQDYSKVENDCFFLPTDSNTKRNSKANTR